MPRALYEAHRDTWIGDLGYGPVFGSRALENVTELSMTEVGHLDVALMRDIAVFDWWILNGDRTLSINGGNPNILWSLSEKRAFIIDHNLAFDGDVTLRSLEVDHIFGNILGALKGDRQLQAHFEERFRTCLFDWNAVRADIPDRWHYIDRHQTVTTGFSIERAYECLRRFENSTMWE